MNTKTNAGYTAPAVARLSLRIERGFVGSTVEGSAGNENYGYADETWD